MAALLDRVVSRGPDGVPFETAIDAGREATPAFAIGDLAAAADYYRANGYVVLRQVLPAGLCRDVLGAYRTEIKPSRRVFYRQSSTRFERHVFCDHGFLLNPLLNVQDLDRRHFPGFHAAALRILSHGTIHAAARAVLGEAGMVVQSMYFEGNPATNAHQDSYYLDSEQLGSMVAAWIALEDIGPGAGRFYVYPGSHRLHQLRHGEGIDIAFNHDRYKERVLGLIAEAGLRCQAPALAAGDVLLWNAWTIHGSLPTTEPSASRNSMTMHLIPESHRFLQFQSVIRRLHLERVDGVAIHHPRNQNRWQNRLVAAVETHLPGPVHWLKRTVIRALVSR